MKNNAHFFCSVLNKGWFYTAFPPGVWSSSAQLCFLKPEPRDHTNSSQQMRASSSMRCWNYITLLCPLLISVKEERELRRRQLVTAHVNQKTAWKQTSRNLHVMLQRMLHLLFTQEAKVSEVFLGRSQSYNILSFLFQTSTGAFDPACTPDCDWVLGQRW